MTELCRAYAHEIALYNREENKAVEIRENECMAHHTTFRIGGEADLFLSVHSEEDLRFLLRCAKKMGVRTLVIGRGSNLLFADAGFRGAVITTAQMKEIRVSDGILTAGAGAMLSACANAALDASLTGFEFAHGIPGSCGGAVFMNAGAYDGEISQVLTKSRYYDCDCDSFGELAEEEHAFGYRESLYRRMPQRIILSASFSLQNSDKAAIREKMDFLMQKRTEKQPLEYPSAGSTFKRCPGRYTAQMIDEAGLKGYTVGGAQVSEKHAGFIINRGNAKADDVKALIAHIRRTLHERFGVDIETEVICVPER